MSHRCSHSSQSECSAHPKLIRDFYPLFLKLATRYHVAAGQGYDYNTFEGFLEFLAKPRSWYRCRKQKLIFYEDNFWHYDRLPVTNLPYYDGLSDSCELVSFARKYSPSQLRECNLDHAILQLLHSIQNYSTNLQRRTHEAHTAWYRRIQCPSGSASDEDPYYRNYPEVGDIYESWFDSKFRANPVAEFSAYIAPPLSGEPRE